MRITCRPIGSIVFLYMELYISTSQPTFRPLLPTVAHCPCHAIDKAAPQQQVQQLQFAAQ